MKAGQTTMIMTMTRNGERRSRSFNSHTSRVSSTTLSPTGSANYNYGQEDVNFSSEGKRRLNEEGKNIQQRRLNLELSNKPSSTNLVPVTDTLSVAPAFIRTSSLRHRSENDRLNDQRDCRLPRRSDSTRDRSVERRRTELSLSTNYGYRDNGPNIKLLLPPPKIVTIDDDGSTHDFRSPSANYSETDLEDAFDRWSSNGQHLLSVPGCYKSPPIVSEDQLTPRSRSRSTPGPELIVEHKKLNPAGSEGGFLVASGEDSDYDRTMHSHHRLQHGSSNPENYGYHPGRPRIDRRVSCDPGCDEDMDEIQLQKAYREKSRKYSCFDATGDKKLLVPSSSTAAGVRIHNQQVDLRRMASTSGCPSSMGSSETPRRRLPPTPDELLRLQQKHKNDANIDENFYPRTASAVPSANAAYLDVNYGHMKKPFLSSNSSPLPGCHTVETSSEHFRRQFSASNNPSLDNEGRIIGSGPSGVTNKPAPAQIARDSAAMILRSPPSIMGSRPGSGRKLPAEPAQQPVGQTPTKASLFRISRQNAVSEISPQITLSDGPRRRSVGQQQAKMMSQSSSSDEEGADWSSPPQTTTPTPSSETSSKTPLCPTSSQSENLLKKFHQSSVSSSSSVPDFQITPTSNVNSGMVINAVNTADAATDSGNGSGAESGIGDGTTISASDSWPDTILSTKIGMVSLSTVPSGGTEPNSRRCSGASTTSPTRTSPSPGNLGLLHFALQYFPVRKRLRISIMKAELRLDTEMNAFIKVCLMPGKAQKQRGCRVVKRSKEATFNEEFFFDNITTEDVDTKSVYVRLCHHVGKQFQKDVVICQMDVALKEFLPALMSKQEIKTCQELKPKQLKKLGRLQISTCLEKDARRLTINVIKADDLPKFGITGPPDPFVRITVDQNGWVQTKQSRTLKSTCNAVFKEAIMFLVSTKIGDLERTKIVITVHDASRTSSGDDAIGHVYLGQLGCDKNEIDQWKNSIAHFGREFKTTHQLKRESTAHANDDCKERISTEDD